MRYTIALIFYLILISASGQESDTTKSISFLFIGDIMGHDTQINAAYDSVSGTYDYNSCFYYMQPVFNEADIAIANLEVTLAGEPYKGYPSFSSPDELARAAHNAGIDILATANNHSCDRLKKGVIRTIGALDSMDIPHTGTFKNETERDLTYPLLIDEKGWRIALLNYTYGTNGIPVPEPTIVNLIDTAQIAKDIRKARYAKPDIILVFFHWGIEYQSVPNSKQVDLAGFCHKHGAHYVIGSHPHVIQKMVWEKDTLRSSENYTAYSLGNFVSNQRKRKTDGGVMVKLVFENRSDSIFLKESGYYLTWVYRPEVNGKRGFYILPAATYENDTSFFSTSYQFNKMNVFIDDSRALLDSMNVNVGEYVFNPEIPEPAKENVLTTEDTEEYHRGTQTDMNGRVVMEEKDDTAGTKKEK